MSASDRQENLVLPRKPQTPTNGKADKRPRAPEGRRSINFWIHALAGSLSKGATRYYGAKFDVRPHEIRLLNTLYNDGARSARDLVTLTAMDKALVSRALAGLVEAGYIRHADGLSRVRLRKWELSEQGERLVERLIPEWTERWRVMLAGFTEDECSQLQTMLERLFQSSETLCALEAKAGKPMAPSITARPSPAPKRVRKLTKALS